MSETGRQYRDKFRGCLVGLALGDAMEYIATSKALLESAGETPNETYTDFGSYLRNFTMSGTANTALALASARCHVSVGHMDVKAEAMQIVCAMFGDPDRCSKRMEGITEVLRQYFHTDGAEGRKPFDLNRKPVAGEGCGNGVAARIAPLALYHAIASGDRASLITDARAYGGITHDDPRAWVAAVAVGVAITIATHFGHNPEKHTAMVASLLEAVSSAEREYGLCSNLSDPNTVSCSIKRALDNLMCPRALLASTGNSGFALESVPLALGIFLRHPQDFEAGLIEATEMGGDIASIAAMVGAMIGANVGLTGIPDEILTNLSWRDTMIGAADVLYDAAIDATQPQS